MKTKPVTDKQKRRGWLPPPSVSMHPWFNYKKKAWEPFKRPETDQAALDHMPQDEYVEPMYRAFRGQGFSILLAMRECFIKIEELKGERNEKVHA